MVTLERGGSGGGVDGEGLWINHQACIYTGLCEAKAMKADTAP